MARSVVALKPPNAAERSAIRRLREEIARLPRLPENTPRSEDAWVAHRSELRRCVLRGDPRAFLTWTVLRKTMVTPPYARFTLPELRLLRQNNWSRWRAAIREPFCGLPLPSLFYP